jgi:hypothetical protein
MPAVLKGVDGVGGQNPRRNHTMMLVDNTEFQIGSHTGAKGKGFDQLRRRFEKCMDCEIRFRWIMNEGEPVPIIF